MRAKVNKFEHVHVSTYRWRPCWGWGSLHSGSLHGEVQCIMGNGHMEPPSGQTDRHD